MGHRNSCTFVVIVHVYIIAMFLALISGGGILAGICKTHNIQWVQIIFFSFKNLAKNLVRDTLLSRNIWRLIFAKTFATYDDVNARTRTIFDLSP